MGMDVKEFRDVREAEAYVQKLLSMEYPEEQQDLIWYKDQVRKYGWKTGNQKFGQRIRERKANASFNV